MKDTTRDIPAPDAGTLLEGIMAGAMEEIRAIEAEASSYARAKAEAAEADARALIAAAERDAEAQARIILKNAAAKAALERRKIELAARERLAREMDARSMARLEEVARTPAYRDLVSGWIIEAAIGLGAETAMVDAGPAERDLVDGDMLREAEAAVKRLSGRSVSLRMAERPALASRGVQLAAEGGRMSYDNRVSTRFARAARALRTIAYRAAYGVGDGSGAGKADRS